MSYKLNGAVWNGVFVVPNCVVDEHIKKAGGQQLKVLLFLLRHNSESLDARAVARGTGMDASDVKDAVQYWKEVGLVYEDGETPPEAAAAQAEALSFKALPDVVPTYEQVAARTLEDANLRALFNEAPLRLGRTIGYGEQSQLLMMLDYYGLPCEVILTVVEYCRSIGKGNMNYIAKVAKDWAEREINTLERADAYLKELKSDERLWKKFAAMFTANAPNYTEKRFALLKHWHIENKQSLQLIYYAYEIMTEKTNKMSFEYMNAILESWHAEKIKTPQEAMQASAKGRKSSAPVSTSYDLEKEKKRAQAPIEYKRKEKKNG